LTFVKDKTLTDEEIYGPEGAPAYVLAERKRNEEAQQERNERAVVQHAENVVYSTEIIDFADTLLEGKDTFTHNTINTKNGVDRFNFGSFEISRSQPNEATQRYAIDLVTMGSRSPQLSRYDIVITNGSINIRGSYKNNPQEAKMPRPQALSGSFAWNSDTMKNDIGESESKKKLNQLFTFMEFHSEKELETREKKKRTVGRKFLDFWAN
jgi:hypothetical protein